MWIALVVVLVIGGFLLFGGQETTQQPEEGVGGGPGVLQEQPRMELQLNAVDEEQIDQSGSAVLEEIDGRVRVTLDVNQVEGLNNQPAHIHAGSCPGVGEIIFPLNNVVNGRSVTEIDTTIDELVTSQTPMAINVHKSAEEISVYTACGDLPQ